MNFRDPQVEKFRAAVLWDRRFSMRFAAGWFAAADGLGITIPLSILLLADEVAPATHAG